MKKKLLVITATLILSGCVQMSPKHNMVRFAGWNYVWMNKVKEEIGDVDSKCFPAYEKLIADADKALQEGVFSVTFKKIVPPSGSKNDYMSIGPYWWPNPSKPDGLPYIRRDGEVNPERNNSDSSQLHKMIKNVRTLSLAWFFSGRQEYATKASELLKVWFLDKKTLMNPNLNYSQAIPGITDGRFIGIIDGNLFAVLVDAIALLETSDALAAEQKAGIRKWFEDYFQWLTESEFGKEEESYKNNHSVAFDVQSASIAYFLEKDDYVVKKISEVPQRRIDPMIENDGRQPEELIRTKAFGYSVANLTNFFKLGILGKKVGVDIFSYVNPRKGSLRKALIYLMGYMGSEEKWPYKEIGNWKNTENDLGLVIHKAALIYNNDDYQKLWEDEFYEDMKDHWELLVEPEHTDIASPNWKEITTVEETCEAYPDLMAAMLDKFNLDYPGMEKVKRAEESGNIVEACKQLLKYYKNSSTCQALRKTQPKPTTKSNAETDTILNNIFVVQNVRGQVPYCEDGHRNWYYKGPNNDSEWAWLSNRHSQLNQVFLTYLATGNPKYAKYIDLFLRDFIIKSYPYSGIRGSGSIWRGLEVAARIKVWSKIFYGLVNSKYLSSSTQLLMLCSLPDHAHYNRCFHSSNNWLTMEISALATVATNFPEYKMSNEWLNYSVSTMTESMKQQVYPDGVQTELTSHYHSVALQNFELFKNICDNAGYPLPDFFHNTIEKMYAYKAFTMRPNGYCILNNDSDLGSDRSSVLKAAEIYHKPEWVYIATNGASGTKPSTGPSYFFPYSGQLISRSGFDADAHWSFFDVGPWGSGHQHNDKLNITISAYGRDLLVDAGRFAYTGDVARKFRRYACGSQGHNVILIDGRGQMPGTLLAREPVPNGSWKITDKYDYAQSSFDKFIDIKGKCEHSRALYYERGKMWVVIDRISTDRPRKIEVLWHLHPSCTVIEDGNNVMTANEKGNLTIIPVGNQKWDINFVKGQEEPEIQGWYSVEYNKYESNVCAIFSSKIISTDRFIWVLFPSEKATMGMKAFIISENSKEIKLRVSNAQNDEWTVSIPLTPVKDVKTYE